MWFCMENTAIKHVIKNGMLYYGEFYATGLNAADFNAYASVTRTLNKKLGDVQVSFQNVNRSPSYIFEGNSSFNLAINLTLKKKTLLC